MQSSSSQISINISAMTWKREQREKTKFLESGAAAYKEDKLTWSFSGDECVVVHLGAIT